MHRSDWSDDTKNCLELCFAKKLKLSTFQFLLNTCVECGALETILLKANPHGDGHDIVGTSTANIIKEAFSQYRCEPEHLVVLLEACRKCGDSMKELFFGDVLKSDAQENNQKQKMGTTRSSSSPSHNTQWNWLQTACGCNKSMNEESFQLVIDEMLNNKDIHDPLLIRKLLEKVDSQGRTVVQIAVAFSNSPKIVGLVLETCKKYIESKAAFRSFVESPMIKKGTNQKSTARSYFYFNRRQDIFPNSDCIDVLIQYLLGENERDLVKSILEAQDADGNTCLLNSLIHGQRKTFSTLLQYCLKYADIKSMLEAQDVNGNTCLLNALIQRKEKAFSTLFQYCLKYADIAKILRTPNNNKKVENESFVTYLQSPVQRFGNSRDPTILLAEKFRELLALDGSANLLPAFVLAGVDFMSKDWAGFMDPSSKAEDAHQLIRDPSYNTFLRIVCSSETSFDFEQALKNAKDITGKTAFDVAEKNEKNGRKKKVLDAMKNYDYEAMNNTINVTALMMCEPEKCWKKSMKYVKDFHGEFFAYERDYSERMKFATPSCDCVIQ